MAEVVRTAQARTDLLEIWLYIAEDSVDAADRLLATIEQKARTLADSPEMGERCEHLAPSLRFFTAGRYVIFYRPVENGIHIIRVVSGARDLEILFGAVRSRRQDFPTFPFAAFFGFAFFGPEEPLWNRCANADTLRG